MAVWVLAAHLVATSVLTGVGWLTQLALYPLFARVGPAEWPAYHRAHSSALVRVVALPWAVQGVSTVALLADLPSGVPRWLCLLDAALAAAAVATTAAVAVPLHQRLARRPDPVAQDLLLLLRANLLRALLWTAAVATSTAMLVLAT